jgi:hypothetical protein
LDYKSAATTAVMMVSTMVVTKDNYLVVAMAAALVDMKVEQWEFHLVE